MPFLSEESFEILTTIQSSVHKQCLDKVNTAINADYKIYAHFMSSLSCVSLIHDSKIFDEFLINKGFAPYVETSLVQLNKMEQIFYTSSNGTLGYFHDHSKSLFKIENEVDQFSLLTFKKNIENCLHIISKISPLLYKFCCKFILSIIPIKFNQTLSTKLSTFSSHKALGTIFLSYTEEEKFNPIDYIIKIAHELGHQVLYLYQTSDELISSDHFALVYSGVRKTFRPAIMSFHATAALTHMKNITRDIIHNFDSEFQLSIHNKNTLRETYNDYTISLTKTIDSIKKNCVLTNFGNEIITNLHSI